MTDYEGKSGFLILLEERENDSKVVKQSLETNLESRLSALESNINDIKNLLFQNLNILTPNQ